MNLGCIASVGKSKVSVSCVEKANRELAKFVNSLY